MRDWEGEEEIGMSSATRVEVGERGVEGRGEERAGRALEERLRAGAESRGEGWGTTLPLLSLAFSVPVLYVSFS